MGGDGVEEGWDLVSVSSCLMLSSDWLSTSGLCAAWTTSSGEGLLISETACSFPKSATSSVFSAMS